MGLNSQQTSDLVTKTEEIHNEKLHFSCSFLWSMEEILQSKKSTILFAKKLSVFFSGIWKQIFRL